MPFFYSFFFSGRTVVSGALDAQCRFFDAAATVAKVLVYLFVCACLCVGLCVCVPVSLFVCVPVCLCVCVSESPCAYIAKS